MNILAALLVATCLGSSLAQLSCPTSKDFSAVAFDALTFAFARTYDNLASGLMMYDYQTDNRVLLFDSRGGIIYRRLSDGSCVKTAVSAASVVKSDILGYTDRTGQMWRGDKQIIGNFLLKRLYSDKSFYPIFVSSELNNEMDFAYYLTDSQPLTQVQLDHVKDTYKTFTESNCKVQA